MQEKILSVVIEGPFEFSALGSMFDLLLEDCAKHGALKALVDLRGVTGSLTIMDRFGMASLFASKYLAARLSGRVPACRFAVYGQTPIVDPKRFGETVAVNRGVPLRVFLDESVAREWLDSVDGS
jgi:hypothetical protein